MRLACIEGVRKCRKTWTALFLVDSVESVPEEPDKLRDIRCFYFLPNLVLLASPSERLRLIQPVREALDSSFPSHTTRPVNGREASLFRGTSSGDVGIILVSGVMTAEYSVKNIE